MQSFLANFINSLFRIIELAIILECILSWVVRDRSNGIMGLITSFTEPILKPFRAIQYKFLGNLPVDLSPIFAIVVLDLIRPLILSILIGVF
ncbi:YggT family protein [Clostridium sp. Ade.TY]|uniref:YggT family protein n=1 Tax=Clostridium sp. Ade.TY TaxID=1391647 RepID=UPI0003F58DEE|nr:YggT family protein [Clostridium sp. Ade.TY]